MSWKSNDFDSSGTVTQLVEIVSSRLHVRKTIYCNNFPKSPEVLLLSKLLGRSFLPLNLDLDAAGRSCEPTYVLALLTK